MLHENKTVSRSTVKICSWHLAVCALQSVRYCAVNVETIDEVVRALSKLLVSVQCGFEELISKQVPRSVATL